MNITEIEFTDLNFLPPIYEATTLSNEYFAFAGGTNDTPLLFINPTWNHLQALMIDNETLSFEQIMDSAILAAALLYTQTLHQFDCDEINEKQYINKLSQDNINTYVKDLLSTII